MSDTNSFIEKKVEEFEDAVVDLLVDKYKYKIDHSKVEFKNFLGDIESFLRTSLHNHTKYLKKKLPPKKTNLNLEPGFNITAEYRLGEIRGYNQALSDIFALLDKGIKE